ncbi:phage tail family protein [Planococcus sp. YIM B11945]|uniref:phage tail family protein n=1 Tax=Planococcus sp. YIM B11945 TaxID=3435410 RepID=UPI003D7D74EA
MNLISLFDAAGNKIDVAKYGLTGSGLVIPSPSYREERDTIPGRDGEISLGRDLEPRQLRAPFRMKAADYEDALLLRDELYALFSKAMYIGETKQPGKWWRIRMVEGWTPVRVNPWTYKMDIPFYCESGKAESYGSTADALNWDADKWQWGMGLSPDEFGYEKTTTRFIIHNAGHVSVDPRQMPLVITLKGTAASFVEIINHTTGETFRYDGKLNASNTLTINGIRFLIDGLSILRQTNKKLITLAPGANDIEVKGVTVERIFFDFKFYYL